MDFSPSFKNINPTTSMTMLYCTYARLRSIQNPKGYSTELLLKYPMIVDGLIWVIWLSYWAVVERTIGNIPLTISVNFPDPLWGALLIIPWVVFLFGVLIVGVYIIVLLVLKSKKGGHKKRKKGQIDTQTSLATGPSVTNQSSILTLQTSLMNAKKAVKAYRLSAEKKFIIIIFSFWCQW